jgi:ribose-phosphate pyrophosphokinase
MRLAEGDRVVAIAAFRAGLAEQDGMGDDGDLDRTARAPPARETADEVAMTAFSAFGGREAAGLYADQFEIYHGNSNPDLARKICRYLGTEPGKLEVFQFANENIFVKILENVREKDVFLVQPTCHPVNQSIMELLIMIDAFKRASAGRITAVIPYYAYGRSDKKDQPRVPITARLIADMITVAGADRVLTMDLHQGQIQGFFNIPVDELTAVHMLSNYYKHKHIENPVVVTDLGFAKRARAFAELLDAPLAIIEKRRVGNLDRAELMNVIGDVKGKRAIIVDDEIDTAGTLVEITRALEREGRDRDLRLRDARRAERPGVDRIAGLEPARGRPDRLGAAPERKRLGQDHDTLRRAAHRRGDPADPPRRIGRRALLERGLADPGDGPLGGRRRGHDRHSGR